MTAAVTDQFGRSSRVWHSSFERFMKYILAGISAGLCFGAALGAATQNLAVGAVGVAMGVALGSSFGLVLSGSGAEWDRKKLASDKPSPYPLGL